MDWEKTKDNTIAAAQTFLILGKYSIIAAGVLIILAVFYNTVVISLWNTYLKPVPPLLESVTQKNFSFEAYSGSRKKLEEALNKLLPIGTPKNVVENLLVQKAKAKMTRIIDRNAFFEHRATMLTKIGLYPCPRMWRIVVEYDAEQRLATLKLKGPCGF